MTGNEFALIVGLGTPLAIVAFVVWAVRAGGKLQAARDARLAAVAAGHGLRVKPSSASVIFAAEGTAAGVPLRMAIDRLSRPGQGAREVLRVVARLSAPRPAISVHWRNAIERTEAGPTFHEVSTGDDAFDQIFVTAVEDDAAALDLLSTVRADLLAFGSTSLSGVESFKVGSEVALVVNCVNPRFFEDGRLEQAVDLVLRLASSRSGYRAA